MNPPYFYNFNLLQKPAVIDQFTYSDLTATYIKMAIIRLALIRELLF